MDEEKTLKNFLKKVYLTEEQVETIYRNLDHCTRAEIAKEVGISREEIEDGIVKISSDELEKNYWYDRYTCYYLPKNPLPYIKTKTELIKICFTLVKANL